MDTSEKKSQIESIAKTITDKESRFLIWGTGEFALTFYEKYKDYLNIVGFVDWKDVDSTELRGFDVKSADSVTKPDGKFYIIVAQRRNKDIELVDGYLDSHGWCKDKDYYNSKRFEAIYGTFALNRVIFNFVEMTITEKCTLRCKNCSQFMPHFPKPAHSPLNNVIRDVDSIFNVVDYTFHFRLLGGETFLHPELGSILEHIIKNYRSKIDYFDIATNGTLIPEHDILELCKKGNVTVSISDYCLNNSYTKRVDTLVNKLEELGVDYRRNVFDYWYEIGFPNERDANMTAGQKEQLFDECCSDWRNFYNGRLYFCSVCACAQRAGLIEGFDTDYFDFSKDIDKRELLFFNLGINENGYNSLCGLCKGYMPSANKIHVKPGEQMI